MADQDWLERALSERELYVENGDFSREVMRALPPRRRRSRISRRKRIVSMAGLTGVLGTFPFLSVTAVPGLGQMIASQWFTTVASMGALGLVAVLAWWLLAVRE